MKLPESAGSLPCTDITQKQAQAFWTIQTPTKSKSRLFAWRLEVFLQIYFSEL